MHVVADPDIPLVREAFATFGAIRLVSGRRIGAADVRDVDALLVRSVTKVDRTLLAESRVRFVGTATAGIEHVDVAYLAARGIAFADAAGSNARSVVEYVVAAMLEMAARGPFRLRGRTLGIVGAGRIGQMLADAAAGLGMQVLLNDPPRQRVERLPHFVSLAEIAARADVITLHVPLLRAGQDTTVRLFDARTFAALERRPILINAARGDIVDGAALLAALRTGQVSGAVLDVWPHEPEISRDLLAAVDIGTPHVAGYSFDGKVNGTRMVHRAARAAMGVGEAWDPQLPSPAEAVREIEAEELDDEAVLRTLVRSMYDIRHDDAALRERPAEFDRLRREYPMRREFPTTTLRFGVAGDGLRDTCRALGFAVRD